MKELLPFHLGSDADNIRYDAAGRKVYVGYGNGGIAVIDPATHKQIDDLKLPAHPESFQLDKKNSLLFANVPDDHSIAIIDLKGLRVTDSWKMESASGNFPMTLDTADNLVIVGPPILLLWLRLTPKRESK